jgi:predicted aspartyl protease
MDELLRMLMGMSVTGAASPQTVPNASQREEIAKRELSQLIDTIRRAPRSSKESMLWICAQFGVNQIRAMIDCGAGPNVMPERVVEELGLSHLINHAERTMVSGVTSTSASVGTLVTEMEVAGVKWMTKFIVTESGGADIILLGLDWLREAEVIISPSKRMLMYESGKRIPCLTGDEMSQYIHPVNVTKDLVGSALYQLFRGLSSDDALKCREFLRMVYRNICSYRFETKYQSIKIEALRKRFGDLFPRVQTFFEFVSWSVRAEHIVFSGSVEECEVVLSLL